MRDWDKPLEPGQGARTAAAAERSGRPQPDDPRSPPPPSLPMSRPPSSSRAPHGAISYLVLDGGDVAGSGLSVPEKVAQGLSARAYLYTDRPAYRPGHEVELRGVVREVVDGQYANVPGASYSLEVYDSRGRQARQSADQALGVRHVPRDDLARRGRPGRLLPHPALAARQERVRRRVRGPGVPAPEDRPGVRPAADRLLPRRADQGLPGRQVPVRDAARESGHRPAAPRRPDPPGPDRRGGQVRLRAGDHRVLRGAGAPPGGAATPG